MEKTAIDRINALARKEKAQGLTEAEKQEQSLLREEYLKAYRAALRGTLDHTVIQYPDGSKVPLRRKQNDDK